MDREQKITPQQPHGQAESLKALVYAAKLTLMDSCDINSSTILSNDAHDALAAAIELAGGFTEAEQAKMESLAAGEDVPVEGGVA